MGVAIAKPHPYVVNNAFPGTWPLINFFSQNNFVGVAMENYTHYHGHMCLIMSPRFLDSTCQILAFWVKVFGHDA